MATSRVKTNLFLTFEIAAKWQNVCYTQRSYRLISLNQPKIIILFKTRTHDFWKAPIPALSTYREAPTSDVAIFWRKHTKTLDPPMHMSFMCFDIWWLTSLILIILILHSYLSNELRSPWTYFKSLTKLVRTSTPSSFISHKSQF